MTLVASNNIPYLDGWRGLAILVVIISHFAPLPGLSWLGEFGVQLFFVLSGYLMSNILFIKKASVRDFFARRASRVLPTFFLFIFSMVIYAEILQPVKYHVSLDELIPTLTFLRTYFPAELNIFGRMWPIGHLWSLNVEEHSYVYLALGVLFVRNIKSKHAAPAFLIASTVILLALALYYPAHRPSGTSAWNIRSEVAALGLISAATIRVAGTYCFSKWADAVPSLLPVLTMVVAIACFATYGHKGLHYTVAPLCMAFSINFLHRTPGLCRRLLSTKVLRWLGVCSFSLYLWQQPFYYAVLKNDLTALIGVVAALCAGTASFYFFENPLRLFLNRVWSEHRKSRLSRSAVPGSPS